MNSLIVKSLSGQGQRNEKYRACPFPSNYGLKWCIPASKKNKKNKIKIKKNARKDWKETWTMILRVLLIDQFIHSEMIKMHRM